MIRRLTGKASHGVAHIMQTYPNPVNFGVTLPLGMATALFNLTDTRSPAQLTATIADGDAGHRFNVVSLTSYRRVRVPGPHGDRDSWEEQDSTDGGRPLNVSRGGNVEILLRFESLQPDAQGRFTAKLWVRD